jgi:NitT/TauT family transport system substrate-binding protein
MKLISEHVPGRLRTVLIVAAASFMAASPYASSAQDLEEVTLTVQNSLVTALVEVALQEGFFEEVGLDVDTVTVANGPAAVTALASGSVQAATNAPEVFLALAGKGQSVKLIAGGSKQLGVLVARPGFEFPEEFPASIESLRGKKIGVTALSSATQYLTIMMLNEAGVDASEVEFVAVGRTPAQALSNSVIDAGFVTGAQVIISQSLGSQIMVDLRSTENCPEQLTICGIGQVGMWAMGGWIEENPETVEKIRRAFAKADMFMQDPANAEQARAFLNSQIPSDSPSVLKEGYADYALSVLSAAFAPSDLERWVEVDLSAGVISEKLDVSTVCAQGTPANEDDVHALAAE